MRRLMFLLAVLALSAFAADITGTWKGTIDTPGGAFDNTFILKADGATLTGTLQGGPGGELKIEEGKIDGDKVSFVVNMEFGKLSYTGAVSGDDLKLKVTFGGGDMPPMEINCKRAK
ncbi:MAG: hypothetical protein ABSF25_00335 [Bryobacteraceae bacterium]|jgi:hypothetical protein